MFTLIPAVSFAFGEKGQWSEGWGMGVSEYQATIKPKVTYLYMACDEYQPVSMAFTHNGKSYGSVVSDIEKGNHFNLIIDGVEIIRPYNTTSHAEASHFWYFLEKAPKAKKIVLVTNDGKRFNLPLVGIKEHFPETGKDNSCKTGFEL